VVKRDGALDGVVVGEEDGDALVAAEQDSVVPVTRLPPEQVPPWGMGDSAAPGAVGPRSEIRRGVFPTVFGWLGAAAGMLAASTTVPGCAISRDQAERLQWSLPWVGTVVFALLGFVLFRWLSARKRFLAVAAAGTVVAVLIFSAAGSLLYRGGLDDTLMAGARFAFLYLGLLGAVIFVAFEARRPRSGVTRTRRVTAAAAATIGPLEVLYWDTNQGPVVAPIAAATWCLSVLACAVLLVLAVREQMEIAAITGAPRPGTPPYRQTPADVEDARLVIHRRARGFVACLLAVAVAGSVGAFLTWRSLPPPGSSDFALPKGVEQAEPLTGILPGGC
jgi:hypothetical protein